MSVKPTRTSSSQAGASIVEIVIALLLIAVLSAMSLPYIANYTPLYKSEDQALKMMDLMREAAQLAVTERRIRPNNRLRTDERLTDWNAGILACKLSEANRRARDRMNLDLKDPVKTLRLVAGRMPALQSFFEH